MAGPIDPRLLRRARATKWYLVAGVAVGSAAALLTLGQAWLLSSSLADIFHTRELTWLWPAVGGLAAVFAGKALLAWLNSVLAQRAAAAVKSQLRRDIMMARLRHPTASKTSTGHLVTLLTQGLDGLDGYFSKYLPQLALAVTVPLILGVAVLTSDWASAVIVVFTLPLIPIFMVLIGWTTKARTSKRWRVQTRLAGHFADLIAGLPTLQVFGRARAQIEGLRRIEAMHRRETLATLRISFLSAFALELLATLSVALVAVAIGFRVVFGLVDLQTALFVLILAPEVYQPVRLVGIHYHDAADGVAAVEAAFAEMEAQTSDQLGTAPAPELSGQRISFEEFGHSYPGSDEPAVTGVTTEFGAGDLVVLAGPSGGGKSTALNAFMGFLRPSSGRITVGGVDLATVDPDSWRSRLAYVGQNPGMVAGTVADNVRIGFPQATDGEVAAALAAVGASDIPAGQSVRDDGEGLSAGERRRVAMARAYVRIVHGGGRFLVLDEPTAGLDAAAEEDVLATLRGFGAGALVVSHRPQVLAAADRVVTIGARTGPGVGPSGPSRTVPERNVTLTEDGADV